ncbi:hypothetical protein [Mesorhizobium sp. B4-1-3]|uniref:hypothetical protein n=1 Tax=Mesorhizobium sp. B4-1-3 TaxID=2589889 RepID=UPI001FEEF201|nr:hypothetical protein [Mesorhizobium sp. B4-1-3]
MAAIETPGISMPCVTRSVPISPEPTTPMRTGLPSAARRARSRASPVKAILVMQGNSRLFCFRPEIKGTIRVCQSNQAEMAISCACFARLQQISRELLHHQRAIRRFFQTINHCSAL